MSKQLACLSILFLVLNCIECRPRRLPAMTLTNWEDLSISWFGPRDHHNQKEPIRSMGIHDVRIAKNWRINAISEDSFLLKDNLNNYDNSWHWDGDSFVIESGELKSQIETYEDKSLGYRIERSYILPPKEKFYIVKYSVDNNNTHEQTLTFVDYVTTTKCENGQKHWGWFDRQHELFMVDQRKCGGFYLGLASFTPNNVQSYQVGPENGEQSPLNHWRQHRFLNNNTVYEDEKVQVGQVFTMTLKPRESKSIYFFRILHEDWRDVIEISEKIKGMTPERWIETSSGRYRQWLASLKQPNLSGDNKALYTNSLILMKNSFNPTVGTFVASFHPEYGFKTWGRDAIFNAMAMDAAGAHSEAKRFFKWMASAHRRSEDGAFHTCYSWWDGSPIGFVEPQFDSAGAFLWGVYQHYVLTKDKGFLREVQGAVRQISSFLMQDHGNGFVKPDYSIWEESSDPHSGESLPRSYFTFTQSLAYAGLKSTSLMELIWGNSPASDRIEARLINLHDAIENFLWNEQLGYYIRGIWSNNNGLDTRQDSSTVALLFTGAISNSTRMNLHMSNMVKALTKRGHGMARYYMDPYFFDSIYSPGGKEVGEPSPPWGVVTMFTAWAELRLNKDIKDRLRWMVNHTAPGYMPVGEAIDGITGEFVMSSCPDIYEHGSVYVWTHLMDQDMVLKPYEINRQKS